MLIPCLIPEDKVRLSGPFKAAYTLFLPSSSSHAIS
jgi:hypothetical protein